MNAVYPDSTITIHGPSCFTDAPISSPSYIILKQILDMPFYLKKFQYVSLKFKDFLSYCVWEYAFFPVSLNEGPNKAHSLSLASFKAMVASSFFPFQGFVE